MIEERANEIKRLLYLVDCINPFTNVEDYTTLGNKSLYVFGIAKELVIASTDPTKPEFLAKVSHNVVKAINPALVGFGPLLQIRSNEKRRGRFLIEHNYQPEYLEDYDVLQNYKKEVRWTEEYENKLVRLERRIQKLGTEHTEELERLKRDEQDLLSNGLQGFIEAKREQELLQQAKTTQETKPANEEQKKTRQKKVIEPIDTYIKEGDSISVIEWQPFHKTHIVLCSINDGETQSLKSNRFLDDLIKEQDARFSVTVGARELHPISRRSSYSFLTL